MFAYYQLAVAPMVPLKAYLVKRTREAQDTGGGASDTGGGDGGGLALDTGGRAREVADTGGRALELTTLRDTVGAGGHIGGGDTGGGDARGENTGGRAWELANTGGRAWELATLSLVGVGAGVASGLFGIGGGMVIAPAM